MKKAIFLLSLFCATFLQAQESVDYKDIDKLTFFGVDFTLAKVFGADESSRDFQDAFYRINQLFQSEPKKYDVNKYFNKRNVKVTLEPVFEMIDNMDWTELKVNSNDYILSAEDVKEHIRNFPVGDASGYGAILIADFLDKGKSRATYDIVVFNIDTREIIKDKKVIGKARGFGLRNFWAHSMRDALKQAAK